MFNPSYHGLMSKGFILLPALFVLALCSAAHGQAGTGTVHLLRSTGYVGAGTGYSVFMDGERICALNNKRYSVHEVPAGSHSFTARQSGTNEKGSAEPLTLEVEAGKSYYIQISQRTSGVIAKLEWTELTENSGKAAMAKLKEDKNCR